MELASATQSEIRLTIEVAFQLANALADGAPDVRRTLDDAGFSRAADASAAAAGAATDAAADAAAATAEAASDVAEQAKDAAEEAKEEVKQ